MSRYARPCSTDLRCCRNDGHEGDHLYPAIPDYRAATPDASALRTVYEVRHDDDEAYYVAATFSDRTAADRLRDRLAAAHGAADRDDCSLDSAWMVAEVPIDDIDPETALPSDLFDVYDDHASVNTDRLPLRAALASGDTEPGGTA